MWICVSGRRAGLSFIATAAVIALCGCVDQFSGRASEYNFQTGDARNTTILLNVMRAAYSQPLAFTDISTIAGTTTASGTGSASIPFPLNHAASVAAQTVSFTPSATASATGTFNVANLDTQEFYYGLQSPLSMQQIANYLTIRLNEIDPHYLLPLLISDIQLEKKYKSKTIKKATLHNRADSADGFSAFYYAMDSLINAGLTVEQVKKGKPTNVGPQLSSDEAKNTRLLAALISAASAAGAAPSSSTGSSSSASGSASSSAGAGASNGLTLKRIPETDTNGDPIKGPDGKQKIDYQLQKAADGARGGGTYRFCFARKRQPYGGIDYSILTQPDGELKVVLGYDKGKPIKTFTVPVGQPYFCGNTPSPDQDTGGSNQKAGEGITITTRSLEGIFYYLGEMVRTELGLASGQPSSLAIPSNRQQAENGQGFRLFRVERRLPLPGEPWVLYQGAVYSLSVDPSGQYDASSRVLQVVSDLLALQSSAKSLPAPNLIAITTP